jgi:hypothetical protein
MFSGEVPKIEASFSLSSWSLFLIAACTEHTLQYIPHGDRYSSFAFIFSPPFSSNHRETISAILLQFGYTVCEEVGSIKQNQKLRLYSQLKQHLPRSFLQNTQRNKYNNIIQPTSTGQDYDLSS